MNSGSRRRAETTPSLNRSAGEEFLRRREKVERQKVDLGTGERDVSRGTGGGKVKGSFGYLSVLATSPQVGRWMEESSRARRTSSHHLRWLALFTDRATINNSLFFPSTNGVEA